MGNIKYRSVTIDDSGSNLTRQIYQGAGVLLGLALDRTNSSGLVTTIYDSARGSTSDPSIYAQTGDTDLGQTVPVYCAGDADIVAGTSTAGVGHGLIFKNGLYLVNSGDSTDTAVTWELWFRPLIKKSVLVDGGATTGSRNIWHGPGLWYGYGIRLPQEQVALGTMDITFTDEADPSGSGPTLMTKTNYATLGPTLRKVVPTTGEDEGGTAVTTAATGAYGTDGILLTSGLSVNTAQASASHVHCWIDALIEA